MMVSGAGMTAPPGMIGAGSALFGAGKYAEMDKMKPDMPESTKVLAAAANGAFEGIFETYLGSGAIGKAFRNIIAKQGREAAREGVKKGVIQGFADLVTKHPALAPLGEGVEEFGTQIAQNIVDKYSGYRPDIKITEGAGDALLIGVAAGASHSAPLYAAQGAVSLMAPEQQDLTVDPQSTVNAMRVQAQQEAQQQVNSRLPFNW